MQALSELSYRLMWEGIELDAPALRSGPRLEPGTGLRTEMTLDELSRRLVAEQSVSTPIDLDRTLVLRLGSADAGSAERIRSASYLQRLAPGISVILKRLVEGGLSDPYLQALNDWTAARRHFSIGDVEDLRFRIAHGDDQVKREAETELAEIEPILEAADKAERARASALIQLGGWIAGQIRRDRSRKSALLPFLAPLQSVVDVSTVVDVLVDAMSNRTFGLLDRWYNEEMVSAGATSWSGDRSEDGEYWSVLLLLRSARGEEQLSVPPERNADWASTEIGRLVDEVLSDADLWREFLPTAPDLETQATLIRSAWQGAAERRSSLDREEVATAELDPSSVAAFVGEIYKGFAQARIVMTALDQYGRVAREVRPAAFAARARVIREVLPKEWFVRQVEVGTVGRDFGASMANDQDQVLFEEMLQNVGAQQPNADADLPVALSRLIADWQGRFRRLPIVLAPDTAGVRTTLFGFEDFDPRPVSEGPSFGRLNGADVFLVHVDKPSPALVADPHALTIREFEDSHGVPIRVNVREIDQDLARDFIERGFTFRDEDESEDVDVRIRRLIDERVIVDVRVAHELIAEPSRLAALNQEDSEPPA